MSLSASLMLHHLLWEEKQEALAEARRVLKPGRPPARRRLGPARRTRR